MNTLSVVLKRVGPFFEVLED